MRPGRASRGLSLAEVLVSITVLALAATIAMVLYDGARRSFKLGDNASEQQQMVRIAFDMLTEDLRLAGFNTNPDGDERRPDEQFEGAWDTAITIRADFDSGRPAAAVPELSLANTAAGAKFVTVSTGNDEIVTYALANDSSSGEFVFDVDCQPNVRDGVLEPITVDGVAVDQDDPPYTLYRITLAPDSSLVRTPLIDNVRSMRFKYYDEADRVIPEVGGRDDAQGDAQFLRSAIRRVELELEGLTRDADIRWSDPVDPVPGPEGRGEYRKFKLMGDVTPRNLGLFGVKDLEAAAYPPSIPPPPTLDPGHCGGLYAVWSPNPPQDEVARYELRYGTDPADLTSLAYSKDAEHYIGGLLDATPYFVTIQAVDDSGNISGPSDSVSATTENLNTPATPDGLTVSSGLLGRIELAWSAVTENDGPPYLPSSDPLRPQIRDLAGYHVYRGTSPAFVIPPGGLPLGQLIIPGSLFSDDQVVNCRPYYYQLRAVDDCGAESLSTPVLGGDSWTNLKPAIPANVQAFWEGPAAIRVRWDAVDRDVVNDDIHIEDYKVYRAGPLSPGSSPADASFSLKAQIDNGLTEYVDDEAGGLPPGDVYYYKVSARDDCVNESDRSETAEPICQFSGDVVFIQPQGTWTPVVKVDIVNGGATYPQLELVYSSMAGGGTMFQTSTSGPPWILNWPASAVQPGLWRLTATVTQANTCTQATTVFVNRP